MSNMGNWNNYDTSKKKLESQGEEPDLVEY